MLTQFYFSESVTVILSTLNLVDDAVVVLNTY